MRLIKNSKRGFTLIEFIMVMVIMGILAGIALPVSFEFLNSFQYSFYRKDLSEQTEVVLRRMNRELRRLRDDNSVLRAEHILYEFNDIDGNTIQFRLNGTNLERLHNGETDVLASDVGSFNLTYLDNQGVVLMAPLVWPEATDIRYIKIDISFKAGKNTIYCQTGVRPWNVVHICDLFS